MMPKDEINPEVRHLAARIHDLSTLDKTRLACLLLQERSLAAAVGVLEAAMSEATTDLATELRRRLQ